LPDDAANPKVSGSSVAPSADEPRNCELPFNGEVGEKADEGLNWGEPPMDKAVKSFVALLLSVPFNGLLRTTAEEGRTWTVAAIIADLTGLPDASIYLSHPDDR
jgi:hypothetical protein